jgi:hypothetical protein
MEAIQSDTFGVEYSGPNPQMEIWYLGALRAAEEMSYAMKDTAFAVIMHNLFVRGSEWTDRNLFNGEFYEQLVKLPDINKLRTGTYSNGNGANKLSNPAYQLERGCLVDQLVGQYMAHICGLGYLLKEENIKTAYRSILKYNYRASINNQNNNQQSIPAGNESGLLIASWPSESHDVYTPPYLSEVMTGFEYTAASGMIFERMKTEGVKTIEDIRNRYDGLKRNPFNEAEYGYHSVRSMASWASVLALTGFRYSGVTNSMKINSDNGNYFWCNGYAWGNLHISGNSRIKEVTVQTFGGSLELSEITLNEFGRRIISETRPLVIKNGEVSTISVFRDKNTN